MKVNLLLIFCLALLIPFNANSQTTGELPFFDDFSNEYENWTHVSIEGDDQWHISGDDGTDGSKCARFYITSNPQQTNDDWLVSPIFDVDGLSNIEFEFKYFYHGDGIIPEFYYSQSFDGNISNSEWTALDNDFWGNEWNWNIAQIEIEDPGESVVFAIRYQSDENTAKYILIDDFSAQGYSAPPPYQLVGSSEHFEFYTNIPGEDDFYLEAEEELEARYLNYVSLWDRPGLDSVFSFDQKIKVNYCLREHNPQFNGSTPDWKCGSIDEINGEIFISPFETIAQEEYYVDLTSLIINELSQLALARILIRQEFTYYPDWYLEGFGLYEMGYRPERSDLLAKLSDLGTVEPPIESVFDLQHLNETGNKDLMASLIESKVIVQCYFYLNIWHDLYDWHVFLKHYYVTEGSERIRLIYSTDNFDYYGNEDEIQYVEPFALDMEDQIQMQQDRFNIQINHRFIICIYENAVGLEITDRTNFQAIAYGADKMATMPLHIPGEYGGMHHEFMHMMVNILSKGGPGQFLNEGLAESTDLFMPDSVMQYHLYKIQDLYFHYQRKYFREPTFLEIIDNAEVNVEDPFWVDAYALGEMFWSYMYNKYPSWIKIKFFLQGGRDWTVFSDRTIVEEGGEFIQFWKELAYIGPPLETTPLPFFEDFENDFVGWTLMRYGVNDPWKYKEEWGIDGSGCAFIVDPYWLEEKDVDSWLVSPPMDCSEAESVKVSFMYKQHDGGIKPELYYAGNFTGAVDDVDWVLVEDVVWEAPEGEWTLTEFNLDNVPERLHLAFRYLSEEGNYATYLIDNFEVSEAEIYSIPTVFTNEASLIDSTSTTLQGNVTAEGETEITQRGFYWSQTNASPDENDNVETVGGSTGIFSYGLTGLTPETTYYFRAFATNNMGTAIGEVKQFTTLTEIVYLVLPFLDDFEETISSDATFINWTTENIEGWHYWHIIPWGGIGGSQCMRFENNDITNNDWLITHPIASDDNDSLKITFSYFYHTTQNQPKLYYTGMYNGNSAESTWQEIEYVLNDVENVWHSSSELIIDNQYDTIYFAFHYQAIPEEAIYFLLDNFSVQSYSTQPPYQLVGSSEHFEFYTDDESNSDYYLEIINTLENRYQTYCGHWNIPGLEDFIAPGTKSKLYLGERNNIPIIGTQSPDWKMGFYERESNTIYLDKSIIEPGYESNYYEGLIGLALHTYAGYAYQHRLFRDRNGNDYSPAYYLEGFGLYEQGYRPNRDSIISFRTENPGELTHQILENFENIHNSSEKDIVVSYVEGQILIVLGYRNSEAPYGSYPPIWNNFVTYFYDTTDVVQIKKYDESQNFDIYCSSRDTAFTDSMKVWLERTRQFYVDSFQMDINIRYPLIILYDEQTGMDLTGYDNFNGGAGSLNISPHNFYDGIEGYPWLLAHEFGHVFNNLMTDDFPYGFFHEGMANFSGYNLYGEDWSSSIWQIEAVFNYFDNNFGREPFLSEFIENPYMNENGGNIDPYFFGFEFIRYLNFENSLLTIREFFNSGLDFSVFNQSYEDIEIGYNNYLKQLGGLTTVNTELPFLDDFSNDLNVYPNPMNNKSTVSFTIINSGNVTLAIYDSKGRKLYTILDEKLASGSYEYQLDKNNLINGLYFISLLTEKQQSNIKLILSD